MSVNQCGYCKITYNKEVNIPLMLSCQDTICKKCINYKIEAEALKKEEFECPICCNTVKSLNIVVKALYPKDDTSSSTSSAPKTAQGEFDVYVKLLTGDRITVRVNKEMNIRTFLTKVAQQANIKQDRLFLSFKKPLNDKSKTLAFYGITHTVQILQTSQESGGNY